MLYEVITKGGDGMGWRERWEDFKENIVHHRTEQEASPAEERKARQERREEALYRSDKSTGSETLDD